MSYLKIQFLGLKMGKKFNLWSLKVDGWRKNGVNLWKKHFPQKEKLHVIMIDSILLKE